MNDRQIYLQRMKTTIEDKCWWLEYISPEIDTIVDFGCAAGDLGVYLNTIYPNRFKYIGIDNDEDMLNLARKTNGFAFYKSIYELPNEYTSNAILILNSVMHEIYSYLSYEEIYSY